jgi:hypothetical protein
MVVMPLTPSLRVYALPKFWKGQRKRGSWQLCHLWLLLPSPQLLHRCKVNVAIIPTPSPRAEALLNFWRGPITPTPSSRVEALPKFWRGPITPTPSPRAEALPKFWREPITRTPSLRAEALPKILERTNNPYSISEGRSTAKILERTEKEGEVTIISPLAFAAIPTAPSTLKGQCSNAPHSISKGGDTAKILETTEKEGEMMIITQVAGKTSGMTDKEMYLPKLPDWPSKKTNNKLPSLCWWPEFWIWKKGICWFTWPVRYVCSVYSMPRWHGEKW